MRDEIYRPGQTVYLKGRPAIIHRREATPHGIRYWVRGLAVPVWPSQLSDEPPPPPIPERG